MSVKVVYHGGCYDGFGAAWAAYKKLGTEGVEYIPGYYGKDPPPVTKDDQLYIVDYSYPRSVLLRLKEEAGDVLVLDHHKTAQKDLEGLPFAQFDMNRSGAGMTWDFFHEGKSRPRLIDHIEDRDLWRFDIPGTREFHAYLTSHPFDFKVWDQINEDSYGSSYPDTIKAGGQLLRYADQIVQNIIKGSWVAPMMADPTKKAAVCATSSHWGEVGEALLKKHPEADFSAACTPVQDAIMWSLRSRDESGYDVSALAKKFGGGGHHCAAGFRADNQRPIFGWLE